MAIAVLVPQTYEEFQEFLPPFEKLVDKVMIQLSSHYKSYVEKKELDKGVLMIRSFMGDYNRDVVSSWGSRTSYRHSDVLARIIHREFSFNEDVEINDEPFVWKIREMSDDYGYEEGETEQEGFKVTYETTIEQLMDEVGEHIDDLWMNELQAYAEAI